MRKFKKAYIEITNICNLSCEFCPGTKRPSGFMSPELFQKIISEVKDRTKFVYLHVLGEPLLHNQLGRLLEICAAAALKVNITTNGTLASEVSDLLLKSTALRQVNFSLHSIQANNMRLSIDQYLDGIFDFIERAAKTNLQICLRLWNLGDSGLNNANRHILDRIEQNFSLEWKLEDKLTPCSGIKISKNLFLNQAQTFKWPEITDNDQGPSGFCYGLRDQIAVLLDGTVVPCCLDGEGIIALGNLAAQSLEDILKSPRAAAMYEGFSQRKAVEPLCRKCTYKQRFD